MHSLTRIRFILISQQQEVPWLTDNLQVLTTPSPLGRWFSSFRGNKLARFLTTDQTEINPINKWNQWTFKLTWGLWFGSRHYTAQKFLIFLRSVPPNCYVRNDNADASFSWIFKNRYPSDLAPKPIQISVIQCHSKAPGVFLETSEIKHLTTRLIPDLCLHPT